METRKINGEMLTLDETLDKNSKLIWSTVQKYKTRGQKLGLDPDDIYNLAAIGFIKAFNNFKPEEFPVKFSTYAVPMMEGELQRWFRDNVGDVKFSRRVIDLSTKIIRADIVEEEPKVIANHLDVTIKEVNEALECILYRKATSTDATVFVGDDEVPFGATIGFEADYTEVNVNSFLDSLGSQDRRVVELTLGGLGQKEISVEIGVSQPHVSRLLRKLYPKVEEFFGYPVGYFQERKTINIDKERKAMAEKKRQSQDKVVKKEKGDMELMKELLKTTKRTVASISKETNVSYESTYYWAKKIREPQAEAQEVKQESTESYYLKPVQIKADKPEPVTINELKLNVDTEKVIEYVEKLKEEVISSAGVPSDVVEPMKVELGVPPVDLDADAAAIKEDEKLEEELRKVQEVESAELQRLDLLERSNLQFAYGVDSKGVSSSEMHILFTQVGHSASNSGVNKFDVSVVVQSSNEKEMVNK